MKNKIQFMASATEITPAKAKELFSEKEIFAYDESQKVEWKLETKKDLEEAIKHGNVLYIENNP